MKSLAASNHDVSDCFIASYAIAKKRLCFLFLGLLLIMLLPQLGYAQVEISEFMASNDQTLFDEDGDASDWIELHNTGSSAVDLAGWYLTDDDAELTQWAFPTTVIAPGDYIVVFASGEDRAVSGSELHTNFKLSSGGEYLALVNSDGSSIISEYEPEYPQQFEDISYGADGYFIIPTPGAANGQSIEDFTESIDFGLPHGIYQGSQTLTLTSDLPSSEIRYTLDGSEPSTEFGCSPPADGESWSYDYYEGTWQNLPDFDALTPVSSGTTDTISTAPAQIINGFGLRFTGCLEAIADGYYTLSTTSSDGSQLSIDGQLIVDNDGVHNSVSESAEVFLSKGLHPVTVDYFNASGENTLSVDWISPLRGQTYLATPNDGQIYGASTSSNDFITFEFDLPADGDFSFIVSAQGVDSTSDSFWVQLDDQAFWQFETGVSTSLQDVTLNNGGNAVSATLNAGEHTLTFFPREDGARIDSIQIVGSNCDGPCGTQELQAEIEDISGIFVMAGLDQEALPGESWFTYSSALSINQTTIIRAVAVDSDISGSKVQTSSYLFLSDVITQSTNEQAPEGWPAGNINGQDMDYGMDPDIVDPDSAAVIASLASLPTISIVTDIENLLHPEFGIYVNAEEKGRYWERPAHIELIDDSGAEPGFSIDAGIRIRGGFSRRDSNPKHPFRFFFRGSYDGDLDYPLFGDEGVDNFEKIDLRSPNNYSWAFQGDNRNTLLREVWSRDTQKALGHPYTRSRYYHMYINGQYWGVTMTQERISKEYAKSYFGGKEKDYDVVKHDRDNSYRFEASEGTNAAWNQIWDSISTSDPGLAITQTEYLALEQLVDFDNLIDYFLSNGYEGDLDGAPSWFLQDNGKRWSRANNWYAMRDRTGDGLKWSFFQHDGEHTLGARRNIDEVNVLGPHTPFDGTTNQFYQNDYMNPYWLHQKLISHIDYRQRVIDRAADIFSAGGVLSNQQGLIRWNEREEQVSPAILAHSARWGDSKTATPRTVGDWDAEVSFVENIFFADRAEVVFAQLLNLGLANEVSTPEVSIVSGTTVEKGEEVFITNTSSGDIYYTTDGSDPRAPGGGLSANAILLAPGQGVVINDNTQLTIRVLDGDDWSPLVQADYLVPDDDDETCYVIPAKNGNTVVFCL